MAKAKNEEHEWYPVWALALYTGMRSGELFALKWSDVNFEREMIFVKSSWNNKQGFKATKSGHERKVPITTELRKLLNLLKPKTLETGFVLPTFIKWERGEQAKILQFFLLSVGLPRIRFHDLRGTWATLLLSAGEAPARVMKVGGWSDMKTMMIYMNMAGIDLEGFGTGLSLHLGSKARKAEK